MTRPGYSQPTGPVGLPTGNPWDLAYPFGQAPPPLKREGAPSTDEGPGYIGRQVDDPEPVSEAPAEDDTDTQADAAPAKKTAPRRRKES